MTQNEFLNCLDKWETFYKNKDESNVLTTYQTEIWFENLKMINQDRFLQIINECFKEYKYMPKLADLINLHKTLKYPTKEKKEKVKCDICKGKGFIIYLRKIPELSNINYQYVARCNCQNARDYMKFPSMAEVNI